MSVLARFSPCGLYRYTLTRELGSGQGTCCFIMLNPSTADEFKLDPTCTRCFNFANAWGYRRLEVLNVYGYRSTDPRGLWKVPDPIGPDNHRFIRETVTRALLVVCAWGTHAKPEHVAPVLSILRSTGHLLQCLRTTKAGAPSHPLYLPGNLRPILYLP